jgi:hypothetical protein
MIVSYPDFCFGPELAACRGPLEVYGNETIGMAYLSLVRFMHLTKHQNKTCGFWLGYEESS